MVQRNKFNNNLTGSQRAKLFVKKHWLTAMFSIISLIVGGAISKIYDKCFPNEPIVIKELKDSIKVDHTINLNPRNISTYKEDSLRDLLLKKLMRLEELKNFERKINQKIDSINSINRVANSKIIRQYYNSFIDPLDIFSKKIKGYSHARLSKQTDYIIGKCPSYYGDYFEINFQLSDSLLTDKVACILVQIEKLGKEDKVEYYDEKFFVFNQGANFIRINSPFVGNGDYRINYGIIMKKELDKEFPFFEKKICYVYVGNK